MSHWLGEEPLGSTTDKTEDAATQLWHRIREPRMEARADERELELPQLSAISLSVRELIVEEEARNHEDGGAFDAIHQKLMDEIEASIPVVSPESVAPLNPKTRRKARFQTALHQWNEWCSAVWRGSWSRCAPLRLSAAFLVLVSVGLGGQQWGRQRAVAEADQLPAQSLVDDYVSGLDTHPLEIAARSSRQTAHWLSRRVGHHVHIPETRTIGARLLGARLHSVQGRASTQTHFLKNGVRLTLYQIHAPHSGLGELGEVQWNRQSFFTGQYGICRLVAWRRDDDIMALVSPLAMREALLMAGSMRENTSDAVDSAFEPA